MQASTLSGTSALDHLLTVVDSEQGELYVDGLGRLVFRERYYRNENQQTALATFGDSGSELRYSDLLLSHDAANVYNDVRATRVSGTQQQATDTTSIASYGRRVLSKSGLLVTTDAIALNVATHLLGLNHDVETRIQSITFRSITDATTWLQLLRRTFGDRITIKRRPPGGGTAISKDVFIESVTHSVDRHAATWTTTWQLSPADQQGFWILEHATLSRLGVTTRLQYQ